MDAVVIQEPLCMWAQGGIDVAVRRCSPHVARSISERGISKKDTRCRKDASCGCTLVTDAGTQEIACMPTAAAETQGE